MKHAETRNECPFRWLCAKMQEEYNLLNKLPVHLKLSFIINPIKDSFRDSSIILVPLIQMDQVLHKGGTLKECLKCRISDREGRPCASTHLYKFLKGVMF